MLGERGRQYATVTPEIRQIPPSSIELVFNVVEGPKVRVGRIDIAGNENLSHRDGIRAMKNLHPIGIPHSILLEDLFAKTYDANKLEEDKDRLRNAYQEKGYFRATVAQHTVTMRDTGGAGFRLPLIKPNHSAKFADLRVRWKKGRNTTSARSAANVKRHTPDRAGARLDGRWRLRRLQARKGMENMKKLYGEFGYIDFVAEPSFEFPEGTPPKIDLSLSVDEGKQFFIRRINFSGNTTTRDKVIRRELFLDEGDMFNTRLWDTSILRLISRLFHPCVRECHYQRDTAMAGVTLKVKGAGRTWSG